MRVVQVAISVDLRGPLPSAKCPNAMLDWTWTQARGHRSCEENSLAENVTQTFFSELSKHTEQYTFDGVSFLSAISPGGHALDQTGQTL